MSSMLVKLPKEKLVMGLLLLLIRQHFISLIDIKELLLVSSAALGMVLQSKCAIGIFDILQIGIRSETQDFIIVDYFLVVLWLDRLVELSFVLVDEIMFLEKSIEGALGFIERVPFLEDLVVVRATVSVVENLKSFVDFVEFFLSLLAIVLIAFGQPFDWLIPHKPFRCQKYWLCGALQASCSNP